MGKNLMQHSSVSTAYKGTGQSVAYVRTIEPVRAVDF